jgi:hypothetical protein
LRAAEVKLFSVERGAGETAFPRASADDALILGDLFSRASRETDVHGAAYHLSGAFSGFWEFYRRFGEAHELAPTERDYIVEAATRARVAAAIFLRGRARADVCHGLDAVGALAVHLGRPPASRELPRDRVADLIALVRIGQNAAFTVSLRHDMANRAKERRRSTLAVVRGAAQ